MVILLTLMGVVFHFNNYPHLTPRMFQGDGTDVAVVQLRVTDL